MTPAFLQKVGEALYGPLWQSALARDLKVADRTVRRWAAGDFRMPPTLADELLKLILDRVETLKDVSKGLR
jgi:DNA-binding transcriptional regulator YiaG